LGLYRAAGHLGDRHDEADTLTRLGDTHHTRGHLAAARGAWQDALDILADLDHPDADTVRIRLNAPPASTR
jgi:hypothetical protein